jgi:hypothetical protein
MIVGDPGLLPRDDDGFARRWVALYPDEEPPWGVAVNLPAEFATPEPDDMTGPLGLALLLAMRSGEPLELQGRVDASLLDRVDAIQDYFVEAGRGRMRRVAVRAAGKLVPEGPPSPLVASCLSRGLDSLHQAALGRGRDTPIDALVFIDRFETIHDDEVRAREIELATEVAEKLGFPLIVVEAPLRALGDTRFDWDDAVGAGLAWVGHALSGGIGRLIIPSSDSVQTFQVCGVGPAIDPLFSSRRIVFESGGMALTRMGKAAWLADHRPDLLPYLKVCFAENRADNCGRCGKCMHTMACLRAAGVLELATGFPEFDLDELAINPAGNLSVIGQYLSLREVARARGDRELETALTSAMRVAVKRRPSTGGGNPRAAFRYLHTAATRTIVRDLAHDAELGVVRVFDQRARRHSYGVGWVPAGQVTAELGALSGSLQGDIALWVLPDGRLATADVRPGGAAPRRRRVRHAVRPLRRRGGGPKRALRRALDTLTVPPIGPAPALPDSPPVGYLHDEPADDRVALWVGDEPTTGDQFAACSEQEILDAGYASPRLLGHLDARAPLTGTLGVQRTPVIPWAS